MCSFKYQFSTLGLFHNELTNEKKVFEVFDELPLLKDLSIDGNEVSSKPRFKYELILRVKTLEMLDEEPIQQIDRDVAE